MATWLTPCRARGSVCFLKGLTRSSCLLRQPAAWISVTSAREPVDMGAAFKELEMLPTRSAISARPAKLLDDAESIKSAGPNQSIGELTEIEEDEEPDIRLPRSVQALYLTPLKRQSENGVPSCDLQLRSYSVRELEFFADFALRAAYYLYLPASGPVPLPRITERWTVPRSNFAHKKSQENFERITMRRLIQIQDGHPDVVEIWLAFLKKHQYAGVGMKANVWDYEGIDVARKMDKAVEDVEAGLDAKWAHFGTRRKTNSEVARRASSEANQP